MQQEGAGKVAVSGIGIGIGIGNPLRAVPALAMAGDDVERAAVAFRIGRKARADGARAASTTSALISLVSAMAHALHNPARVRLIRGNRRIAKCTGFLDHRAGVVRPALLDCMAHAKQ